MQEVGTLRRSHVIPEFCYKPIYDSEHKMLSIEPHRDPVKVQKGGWEWMLCDNCEGLISKYESHFAQDWPKRLPEKVEGPGCLITGLDYSKYKLFHLSILWRASVANRYMFTGVSLGPHEDRIRTMLIEEDPGDEKTYQFWAMIVVDADNRVIKEMAACHGWGRDAAGHRNYQFTFAGCCWCYFVGSHYPTELRTTGLTEAGTMALATVKLNEFHHARDFAKKMNQARRRIDS